MNKCGEVTGSSCWVHPLFTSSCNSHRLSISLYQTLLPHSHSASSCQLPPLSPFSLPLSLCRCFPLSLTQACPLALLSLWQVINEQAAVGEEASAAWISNGTVDSVGVGGEYRWSVPWSTKCTTLCVHIHTLSVLFNAQLLLMYYCRYLEFTSVVIWCFKGRLN